MIEYFNDIEQARNLTEIRDILYLISKKYARPLASIYALLDEYQGRYRQVEQRFKALKKIILNELKHLFVNRSIT